MIDVTVEKLEKDPHRNLKITPFINNSHNKAKWETKNQTNILDNRELPCNIICHILVN